MINNPRIFVEAILAYCKNRGIAAEPRSNGWLIVMQRGEQRRLAFGYDLGLNNAVAHRIANDKAATSDLLSLSGIANVPHTLYLNPALTAHIPPAGSWQAMLDQFDRHAGGVVVKPNEGTSGRLVFLVKTRPKLEHAAQKIFASHASLAISPYLDIEDEVRVVLLDGRPLVVYRKQRPCIIGDGKGTLLELARAAVPAEQHAAVLRGLADDLAPHELAAIVPAGERRIVNWRHNLDLGAQPVLLHADEIRDTCVALAARAANTVGIRFGSVDVVQAGGGWLILEINSGVMMEALGRHYPELVHAVYGAALDKLFDASPA